MRFVLIGFVALFFAWTFCPSLERGAIDLLGDINLDEDCRRLVECLVDGGEHFSYDVDLGGNFCVVHKGRYKRNFKIVELRGSLRACELVKGYENLGRFGI